MRTAIGRSVGVLLTMALLGLGAFAINFHIKALVGESLEQPTVALVAKRKSPDAQTAHQYATLLRGIVIQVDETGLDGTAREHFRRFHQAGGRCFAVVGDESVVPAAITIEILELSFASGGEPFKELKRASGATRYNTSSNALDTFNTNWQPAIGERCIESSS